MTTIEGFETDWEKNRHACEKYFKKSSAGIIVVIFKLATIIAAILTAGLFGKITELGFFESLGYILFISWLANLFVVLSINRFSAHPECYYAIIAEIISSSAIALLFSNINIAASMITALGMAAPIAWALILGFAGYYYWSNERKANTLCKIRHDEFMSNMAKNRPTIPQE